MHIFRPAVGFQHSDRPARLDFSFLKLFRTVRQVPFKMICASYDQLKIGAAYLNKSEKSVIHMDSSGKFLRQGKGKKKLLNTAIVIPPPAPGHAAYPILELISEQNKTIDYKIFLQEGWSFIREAIKF